MSLAWVWNIITGKWERYDPNKPAVNAALRLDRSMKEKQHDDKQKQQKKQ